MKINRFLMTALLALGMLSCTDLIEETGNNQASADGRYDKVLVSLTSTKGQSIAIDETRVHVGNTSGNTVTYYWDESDKVGIFTLNSSATVTNSQANIDVIMQNKNRATFSGMIDDNAGSGITNYDLFVYYPYNSSMLSGQTGKTAATLLQEGLTFRVANEQLQNTYSSKLDDYNHPSRNAVSTNGFAYDFVDCKGTVGTFELNHVNTYLQFNVIGKKTDNGDGTTGTDFANGKHRMSSLTVEAGTFANGEFSNKVAIAGNYTIKYNYSASTFEDNPSAATVALAGSGSTSVKTTLNAPADGTGVPALSGTTSIPVFSVINTSQFKQNGVNCLKVSLTCNEYNESGAIVKVNTRIRYYNIASVIAAGHMVGGDYFPINFEMSDPVETYTHLDADDTSNCYIIQGPGFYTFNANIAGNGQQPHPRNYDAATLGFDPQALITSDKFKLDWLWASGTSFDALTADSDIARVETIIKDISLSGTDGIMQIQLANEASALSGNIMIALYEDLNGNDKCDSNEKIAWSWHLWLGSPVAQHYRFANTDTDEPLNNEDWYMFDRNLGAESNQLGDPRAAGLYYQCGRKDPFIGYASQSGNTSWASNRLKTYLNTVTFPSHAQWTTSANGLDFNVANVVNYPMSMFKYEAGKQDEIFLYGWVQGIASAINNSKAFFDPCPPGYKTPTTREWDNFKNNEYYNANKSITGTGVFGYCAWKDASFSSNTAGQTMKARVNAGDYYEVNNADERTYHIYKGSANGQVLTTNFPNTGWLSAAGVYNALVGATSTTTKYVVGAPQLSSVSGTATSTTTTLASPTVQATAITDGETQQVTTTIYTPEISVTRSRSGSTYTWTITLNNQSEYNNSGNTYRYYYTTSSTFSQSNELTFSNGTARITGSSTSGTYYIWAYNADKTTASYYASFSRNRSNPDITYQNNGTDKTVTTNNVPKLTGYQVEMSRLAGLSYYWTTTSTFNTNNPLTSTQFVLNTDDTDIYIWAVEGSLRSYTRVQYNNGNVTVTKQNAANVVTTNISNYVIAISNYDAAKDYYWTTTPTFARTNAINVSAQGQATIATSSEQIYIWAYNPNNATNSASSMASYADKRFLFTNGTPAVDSEKTETTNTSGVSILWSTGRIETDGHFESMWFGPGNAEKNVSYELGSTSLNPYSTTNFTLKSSQIMYIVAKDVNTAWDHRADAPAVPVRCIREYNKGTETANEK